MTMNNIDEIISSCLKVLRDGGTILYPTDTVWGIGCDATNPTAVEKVYAIKHRSDSKALVLLASDMDMICRYVKQIPDMAVELVEVNDRPMTIIYPEAICGKTPAEGEKAVADKHFLAYNAVAEDRSVVIRIPDMEFCKKLVYKLGHPIVSTSANISGEPTPSSFAAIDNKIKDAVDYVVPSGLEAKATGMSSQIIKVGMNGEISIIRG